MGALCISKSEIKNTKHTQPLQKTSPVQPIKQTRPQNQLT